MSEKIEFFIRGGNGYLIGQFLNGRPEWTTDPRKKLLMPLEEAIEAAKRIHLRGFQASVVWHNPPPAGK